MGENISSKREHRIDLPISKEEAALFSCSICCKPLPKEYFEVSIKKPKGKFSVCSNDCEQVLWHILGNLK